VDVHDKIPLHWSDEIMASKSEESGMDALKRLSRQTANMGQKLAEEEKQKAEQEKNVQDVMYGLRGISFSVALNQLKSVAPEELYEKVEAMQAHPDAKDLRKLISDVSRTLERTTSRLSRNDSEFEPIAQDTRILAILISLLFSIQ
jgi:hypothetical protein